MIGIGLVLGVLLILRVLEILRVQLILRVLRSLVVWIQQVLRTRCHLSFFTPLILGFFEETEGAFNFEEEAGFEAVEAIEGAGVVGEVREGDGEAGFLIEGRVGAVQVRGLTVHGVGVSGGLDVVEALETPVGGSDFADEAEFEFVGGLEALDEGVEEGIEGGGVLVGEDDGGGEEAVAEGGGGDAGATGGGDGSGGGAAVGGGGGALGGRGCVAFGV